MIMCLIFQSFVNNYKQFMLMNLFKNMNNLKMLYESFFLKLYKKDDERQNLLNRGCQEK